MAKRKGPSTSGPRGRKKAAKEGRDAKTSEGGGVEDECDQLRREFYPLEEKRAKLLEKEHKLEVRRPKLEAQRRKLAEQEHKLADEKRKLEEEKRKLEEPLPPLRREVEKLQQSLLPKSSILKELCSAREAENAKRLDKLPREVWDKVFDELKENDLFPLALSCRYFCQKQKELVARTRESGPESEKPRLTLTTTLCEWPRKSKPASSDYVRFCSKEKVRLAEKNDGRRKAVLLRRLAAFHGHLPLLQELLKPLKTLDPEITGHAARGGQPKILQSLNNHTEVKLDWQLFSAACAGGNMAMLKWLKSEGCPWGASECYAAAWGGHLEILKWLRSEGCPWDETVCRQAAFGGHLEVLRWLRSEGCPWNVWACTYAAKGGHLEVLQWLRSEGCPWDKETCTAAVLDGCLEVLKWLRSEGCPWDWIRCGKAAAQEGHLEILKWLRSEGCPWDAMSCIFHAAGGGHLEILKWLRSEGCPWDEVNTCSAAAQGGQLDVLKYLHENGCPWNADACLEAAEGGHLDVLKYLLENGCPRDGRTWEYASESTRKWLKENGYPQHLFGGIDDEYSDDYSEDDE